MDSPSHLVQFLLDDSLVRRVDEPRVLVPTLVAKSAGPALAELRLSFGMVGGFAVAF